MNNKIEIETKSNAIETNYNTENVNRKANRILTSWKSTQTHIHTYTHTIHSRTDKLTRLAFIIKKREFVFEVLFV